MEYSIPIQSQGHNTAINGFGFASNKHLNDWILFHKQSYDDRQKMLTEMDPKIRDTKPYLVEKERVDAVTYDEYERILEIRMATSDNFTVGFKRDPYREEFIHEDIYNTSF
jgi:hypothetical protein